MPRIRIKNHEFAMSDVARIAHFSLHESLLFMGAPKESNDKTFCVGVGIVKTIQKGEEFDLVGIDFGRGFAREIYVKNNHARRQIYTLKKGQLAWFYGYMKVYTLEGKKKVSMFAKGFQGWFVPRNMDIIKIDPNDIETMTEENESKINFIDELLKGEE